MAKRAANRPADLIDYVLEHYGTIRLKSAAKPGSEGYYDAAYDDLVKTGAGRKLFGKTGSSWDEIADNLRRDGLFPEHATVDDVKAAFKAVVEARRAYHLGRTPEATLDRFWKVQQAMKSDIASHSVDVGDLSIGDKFKIKGEHFEITAIDPETGEVTVKDGRKFGVQTVPDGEKLQMDRGSLKKAEGGEWPEPPQEEPPAFTLEKPESVEEQKARMAKEESVAKAKADREKMLERQAAPIVGRSVETTGDLFDPLAAENPLFAAPTPGQGPGLVGMGGVTPSEFAPRGASPMATKYRQMDAWRARRGLQPLLGPERVPDQATLQKAFDKLDQDPAYGEKLVSELNAKPRTLEDWENHVLLLREIDLRNNYYRAADEAARAYEDSQRFPQRAEDLVRAKADIAHWSDEMSKVEKALRVAGTAAGRALRARQVLVDESFELVNLERDLRASRGGEPITDTERAQLKKMADDYAAKAKAAEERLAAEQARTRQLETEKAIAEAKAAEAAQPRYHPEVIKHAEDFVRRMEAKAAVYEKELLGATWSPTPETLAKAVFIGATRLARGFLEMGKWSAEMIRVLGEQARPYLAQIRELSEARLKEEWEATPSPKGAPAAKPSVPPVLDLAEEQAHVIDRIANRIEKDETATITPLVQKLVRLFVAQGTREMDPLIDQVHGVLSKLLPELTRREAMDAISGYGDFKQLSKDAVETIVRDLKGQMQQTAKLQDMAAGTAPAKTGVERRAPSQKERALIKQVEEAKRRGGFRVTDPAKQLKTAMQSVQTRLTHEIEDYDLEIKNRARIVKDRTKLQYDEETNRLKALRDARKAERDALLPKPGRTEEERTAAAIKILERQEAEYRQRVTAGEIAVKRPSPWQPAKPELKASLDAARAKRDAAREELQHLRDLANPKKTPGEIANQAFQAQTARRIADMQDRMARGDFSPKPKREFKLDQESLNIQAAMKDIRNEFERMKEAERLKNRAPWQRWLDKFVKAERAFKLSSPVVFGKLSAAALTRVMLATPAEEALGGMLRHVPGVRDVMRQAPREGRGFESQKFAEALRRAIMKAVDDASETLRTGSTKEEKVYGRKGQEDRDWMNLFGRLHGMLKSPVKRFEFEYSLQKRIADAIDHGLDPANDLVRSRLISEAIDDGYRSIFMQHGLSSDAFNSLVGFFENYKRGGRPGEIMGEVAARALRFFLPVVRVPMNIVSESGIGVAGAPLASLRTLVHAYNGTLRTLDPVVADSIARQFKKGSIGLALMAVGYFSPQIVGGLDWREKRKPGAVKTAGFQVGGWDIPRWMTHAPWFLLMQMGATIRHVKDQKIAKTGEEKGISEGMWAAGLGLIEETPFVGQMVRGDRMFQSANARQRFLAELAKGTVVPQAVQRLAEWTDPKDRQAKTIAESIQSGIPILREKLPEKRPRQ